MSDPQNIQVRFGERVRTVRSQKGISQEALADKAGLHRTYVSSVERGERNVSLSTVERLAAALEISMADLMPTSEGSRQPSTPPE